MTKVFLSYRHEDGKEHPKHQQNVKELGKALRAANCEVVLDQFFIEENSGGPDEGWPRWSEAQATRADRVLIVGSAGYFRCYEGIENPGTGLGAARECNVIRNILYQEGYSTAKFRLIYFDKSDLDTLPNALFQLGRFNASDPKDLERAVEWISRHACATVDASGQNPVIKWPALVENYQADLANRGDEFNFFKSMLSGSTSEQALFMEAPSNHGKTTLLKEYREYASKLLSPGTQVTVDFKGDPSKEFALDTIRIELAKLLPRFSNPESGVYVLRTELRVLSSPTLLIFDTYEKASNAGRELVEGLLLAELYRFPAVRVVIAGQNVPDYTKAMWAHAVRHFVLGPIKEPTQWYRFAGKHYGSLTSQHIDALTLAAGGNPGTLRAMLETVSVNLRKSA